MVVALSGCAAHFYFGKTYDAPRLYRQLRFRTLAPAARMLLHRTGWALHLPFVGGGYLLGEVGGPAGIPFSYSLSVWWLVGWVVLFYTSTFPPRHISLKT